MRTALLALFSLVLSTTTQAQPAAYALVGVHVIPMDTERVLTDQTVLLRDGRIEALGPRTDLTIPPSYTRLDAAGHYLIPGLIDMHAHLLSDDRIADAYAPEEFKVIVANGVTTVRNPIGKATHLRYREALASGEMFGPRLYVGSPQFASRAFGRVYNGYAITTPEGAAAAVRQAQADGYDFIKITFWIPRNVYDTIIATAAAVGLPVIGHVGPQVGLARALEAGQQIEHLDEYYEALLPADVRTGGLSGVGIWNPRNWQSMARLDTTRIPELARATAAAGVWNTPTLAFLNTSFGTGRSDAEIDHSPDARFVSPAVRADLLRGRTSFWRNPPPEADRLRYVAVRQHLTKALHDAGARLMAGSDAPEWLLLYGFTLHRELQHLVAAGLPPYAALAAATRTPAAYLGGLGTFGTITPGKRADLVLLRANPLDDIRHTQAIEGVFLRGEWLDRTALDRLLDEAAASLSQAPLREPEVR